MPTTPITRRIEGYVYIYKPGSTVYFNGRPYVIDHTIIRGAELLLSLRGIEESILSDSVQIDPTYFCFDTTFNERN